MIDCFQIAHQHIYKKSKWRLLNQVARIVALCSFLKASYESSITCTSETIFPCFKHNSHSNISLVNDLI